MTRELLRATVHRAWAADLDPGTLYRLLRLRVDVFVVEQACPYPELDGRDLEDGTRHLWLTGGNDESVLGCLRLLTEPDGALRIGRLCTALSARGHKLGVQLMHAALAEVGDGSCVLDAQAHLAGFYRGFGFTETGPAYDWDGVPHLPMVRRPPSSTPA
jgi:ElaA protein